MSDGLSQQASQPPAGGAGGGPAGPTFTAPETDRRTSIPVLTTRLPDAASRADRPVMRTVLADARARSSVARLPLVSTLIPESRQRSSLGLFTVTETAPARSGSPDADRWGDGWTSAAVGQTGVNHGADAALVFQNAATGDQRAFMAVDLTRFTGLTATGSHSLTVSMANASVLTAVTATLSFGAGASRPFTESTLVQTNQPATPSLFTLTQSLPASTAAGASYVLSLSDSQMNQLLGKWALIVFTSPAATVAAVSVAARESANKAVLSFTATR